MMKKLLSLVLILLPLAFLFSDEFLTFDEFLAGIKNNFVELKKEELNLQKAEAQYFEQLSFLFPTISFSLPANLNYLPLEILTISPGVSTEIENSFYWSFAPSLALSYMLPTSGTFALTLNNNLIINQVGSSPIPNLSKTTFTNRYNLGINLLQPIFFEDAFSASIKIVEKNYEIARTRYLSLQNNLLLEALTQFLNLQLLQEKKHLARLIYEDNKLIYQDITKRYQAGTVNKLTLLKAEAALKKAELDLTDAEAAFSDELSRLQRIYGLGEKRIVQNEILINNIPALPPSLGYLQEVENNNLELKILKQVTEINQARLVTLRCENANTMSLGANLTFKALDENKDDIWQALSSPWQDRAAPIWSFSFKLQIKILDGGASEQRIKASEIEAQIASLNYENQKGNILESAANLLKQLERLKGRMEYAEIALALAREELTKAETDFKLGQISQQELARFSQNLLTATIVFREVANSFILLNMRLHNLLGKDLYSILNIKG